MKIDAAIKRMEYYVRWFNDLKPREKNSLIGAWVRERIDLFYQAIIHEMNSSKSRV